MSESWLGDCNVIDKTKDCHKSELQKIKERQRRLEIKTVCNSVQSVFNLIDDKIGIDLLGIIVVLTGYTIFNIYCSYYF